MGKVALSAVVLFLLAGLAAAKPKSVRGKRVALEFAPGTQRTDVVPVQRVTDSITVGGASFAARIEGKKLFVARAAGEKAGTKVQPNKTVTFTLPDKRKITLKFVRDRAGGWRCYSARALRFRFHGHEVRLVDANHNGIWGEFNVDGLLIGNSNVVVPFAREFVLAAENIAVRSFDPQKALLTLERTPLPSMTEAQREALILLNRRRANHGLLAVTLDDKLSRACTSHADYLKRNNWTGFTNPHGQDAGAPGASPEGLAAARRSVIQKVAPAHSVTGFWTTYYHRIPLIAPALASIGINARPPDTSVIDAAGTRSIPGGDGASWPWTDPVTVPADGSIGMEPRAVGEKPTEPVPNLGSRGTCLIAVFRDPRTKPTAVRAEMVALKGKREIKLKPLLATDLAGVLGVIPSAPLTQDTWHRVTLTYTIEGKAQTRVVRFRTGG